MSSLPPAFINGNTLDASELNLMRGARNGDLTPIDPGTNNELTDTYDVGSNTSRWKGAHFESTDEIVIGGVTLTQILEDNVIDANCSDLVVDHLGDIPGGPGLNFIVTKSATNKLLRIFFSNPSTEFIDITIGTLPTRTYDAALGTDWFDISGEPDGNLNIQVQEQVGVTQSSFLFKSYFNAF